jgi:uncharacterized membrane protein
MSERNGLMMPFFGLAPGRKRSKILLMPSSSGVIADTRRRLLAMSTDQIPVGATKAVLVAKPAVVRSVPFEAPWLWLAAGWRDMWMVPKISLTYGGLFAAAAAVLLLALTSAGWALAIPVGGCLLMIGPLVAVGLYETSRRIERGEVPRLEEVARAGLSAPGQIGFMGAVLMLACYVWVQLAFLLFMLFFGTSDPPQAGEFVRSLLSTLHGLGLLVVGSLVGAAFAAGVFALSVVSVPLMLVRPVNVVSAMATSFDAVLRNPQALALWAVLIASFMLSGVATACIGLVFVFPLIGHASWHAFKDLVAAENPQI